MKYCITTLLCLCCLLAAATNNIVFGTPGKADIILDRPGYALGYSFKYKQAVWVMYMMTREEVQASGTYKRTEFKVDTDVPGCALPVVYTNSGYDKGHLAPAADMAFSARTMQDSFLMSNIAPQRPAFNRGIWRCLEKQVREFATTEGVIYVVTGPIFTGTCTTVGISSIPVPEYFYKVVYDTTPPEKMIGFILPNAGTTKMPEAFVVTVDAVEAATGLDFFPALPKKRQEELESTVTVDAWRWL